MKIYTVAAILFVFCLSGFAKANKPEMLFHVSFDKFNAHADFAKGDPKSSLTTSLELRSTKGISKSALLLEKGEICTYAVKDNLDMNAGTISFWVCPLNWSWTDKRFFNLFSLSSGSVKNPEKNRFTMNIYVPGPYCKGGGVGFYCSFGVRKRIGFKQFYLAAPLKWKAGEWHKIDCAWDSRNMKLYIDGKLEKNTSIPDIKFPKLSNRRFSLTNLWTGRKRTTHDPDDRAIIDEFKIYRGMLLDADIKQNYLADMTRLSGPAIMPETAVPQKSGTIDIDGKLDDPAWKNASVFPIMTGADGFTVEKTSQAFMTWDNKYLYIGMSSRQKSPPITKQLKQDARLWEDDSFEFILTPPESKNYFHFIVNSLGNYYDTKCSDKKWNCAGIKTGGHTDKDFWSVELAIPFASLGMTNPKNGDVLQANLCRNWIRRAPLKPMYTAWASSPKGYVNSQGKLKLIGANTGIQLGRLGNPATGLFSINCNNTDNKQVKLNLNVKSDDGKKIVKTFTIAPKAAINKDISIARFGDCRITIDVRDFSGSTELLLPLRVYVKEPIAVEYIPYVREEYCLLEVDLSNLSEQWYEKINKHGVKLHVEVSHPDGGTSSKDFNIKKIKTILKLPLKWEDGKYTFKYTVSAPEMLPASSIGSLVKPPTPWLNAKSGITTQVLTPWTPLKYLNNNSISCWGRTYKINGPLLKSVINKNKDQLVSPIKLELLTSKGSATLVVTNDKFTLKRKYRAEWTGRGSFDKLDGEAAWSSFMEYDGLVSSKLTLIPPEGGWEIKALTMTIPLRKDLAKYIRKPKRVKWNGKKWSSDFTPYVWIGNEYEGFCWFFDSDMNWNNNIGEKPISIKVEADKILLTLQIVSKSAKVTKPMNYLFGFMASPVRPMMKNWRNVKMNTSPMKGRNVNGWCTTFSTQQGILDVAKPKEFKKFCQEMIDEGKGVKFMLYAGASCAPDNNPTWNFFHKRWENPYYGGFYNMKTPKCRLNNGTDIYNLVGVAEGSGWVDYLTWLGEQTLKKYPVNSIYTDMDRANMPYNNPYNGSGYQNDSFGKSGVSYAIIPRRQFYKRLLTVCRNAPNGIGKGMRLAHAHDELVLPYHSFNDMFYPGENYAHKLYNNPWFYLDTLDSEAWRCELIGKASGINHVFLPQFVRGTRKKSDRYRPELAESLFAIALVNDFVVSGAYCEKGATEKYWALREKAGITEPGVKSVCYWEKGCPVKAIGNRAYATAYITPKGIAIGIGNYLDKDQTVRVEVNLKKLDLSGQIKARDLQTGKILKMANNSFSVLVKKRNYTIVTLF